MTDSEPVVLVHPTPRRLERVFDAPTWAALNEEFEVVNFEANPDEALFDKLLPRAFAVIGQPDLPTERLEAGAELRTIINVEGNFSPNVDHPTARSIESLVLSPHRAGGIPQAYLSIGVLDDLRLRRRGLPPARLQVAAPELVGRYRNMRARPVSREVGDADEWRE